MGADYTVSNLRGWSMVMSGFAMDVPPPASAVPRPETAAANAAGPGGADRRIHARNNDRVYQSAGDQYIIDHGLPTPAAAANTLPRDVAAFTGRDEELDSLTAIVTQRTTAGENIPITIINGMPGVGKTALAVRLAHLLSSSFPDGQMFVDMHAHTPSKVPTDPAEALFALVSLDGTPASGIPDDVDGRAALWRARMAGRRAIIIIDNVIGHRQVEPLLPGSAGCLVLVTSRRRLTGLSARHAATTVSLPPLPANAAADLFARLTGRAGADQEQAITELVRLCGCLPLAISLLAARLRPEPQWKVERLLEDLIAAQDRLAYIQAEDLQVAAAFNLSYRCLPAARRRFFRRLGLFLGTEIDAYAAAALADVEVSAARRHLDALYDDHLVDQPVLGRYRLHDLLSAYARALAVGDSAQQQDLAVGRLLDYYQHTARVADRRLAPRPRQAEGLPGWTPTALPTLSDEAQATAWMDAELPNLLMCVAHVTSHGDEERLIGMSGALATYLRRAGLYRQSIALHHAAAAAAGRRGDRAAQAAALYHIGVLLRRIGDYPAATRVLTDARRLRRALGDRLGEADVLTVAGIVRRLAGDHGAAAELFDGALTRFRELADPAGEAEVLGELAVIHWLADDYSGATELLEQALALYREAGNHHGQADVLLHLGMVRRLIHDYPAATRALQEAISLYRSLAVRVGVANAQFTLGVVQRLTGDYRDAGLHLEESLQAYGEVGDRLGRANALQELGVLRRLTGDHLTAMRALVESLAIYGELGNRRSQAEALQELGVVRQRTGDTVQAADDLTKALTIYEELDSRTGQAEVRNYLGWLLLDGGDPQALDQFQTALRLARQVHNPLEEAHAWEGIGRYWLSRSDADAAIEHLHGALETYRRLGAPEAAQVERTLTSLAPD